MRRAISGGLEVDDGREFTPADSRSRGLAALGRPTMPRLEGIESFNAAPSTPLIGGPPATRPWRQKVAVVGTRGAPHPWSSQRSPTRSSNLQWFHSVRPTERRLLNNARFPIRDALHPCVVLTNFACPSPSRQRLPSATRSTVASRDLARERLNCGTSYDRARLVSGSPIFPPRDFRGRGRERRVPRRNILNRIRRRVKNQSS